MRFDEFTRFPTPFSHRHSVDPVPIASAGGENLKSKLFVKPSGARDAELLHNLLFGGICFGFRTIFLYGKIR
ncbi:MAG: hypothetical protein ACFB9N_17715, partial [Geitlerinemataceae cyanobacterium]